MRSEVSSGYLDNLRRDIRDDEQRRDNQHRRPGRGFTNILDFRIANAFYPSIPESGIQRDLIEGLYMPLSPTP